MTRAFRWTSAAVCAGLLVSACAGSSTSSPDDESGTSPATVEQVESSDREDVPSALENPRNEAFAEPLVDSAELLSGGPPPDGIPPIDEPKFLSVSDVQFLESREPVLFLDIDGAARAYPVQVMTWHEIVNDTVAGRPITVSYCPLCNSAIAYDRRLGDRVLDFGTSGMLWRSALVMYDRQTETLWSHYNGQAIIGHLVGETLQPIPVQTVSWDEFADAHPDGLVLSRDTGFDRDYGRNPYPGYDDVGDLPFLYEGEYDDRYAAKTRIVGITHGQMAYAIPLDHLRDEAVVEFTADTSDLVAWHRPGTASALSDADIADGTDVGTTGVFDARVDGQLLHFEANGKGFRDAETGSLWTVLGAAVDGPLRGERLAPIVHVDTFWFAWAAYQPATSIVDG